MKKIILPVLIVSFLFTSIQPALACTPMPPDPWFVISDYTIDESTLPAGVEFLVTEVAEERNVYVDGSWQIRTTKVKKRLF